MFADDIFVFCPSVRWLQKMLDVCQAYAESMVLFATAPKLFVWRLRLRVQKAQAPHYSHWVTKT